MRKTVGGVGDERIKKISDTICTGPVWSGVGVVIPAPVGFADGVADVSVSQKPYSLYVPSPAAEAVFICPIGSNTIQMQIAVKIYHAVHFLFFI